MGPRLGGLLWQQEGTVTAGIKSLFAFFFFSFYFWSATNEAQTKIINSDKNLIKIGSRTKACQVGDKPA